MRGIYINIPFDLGSLWIEWREQSVGLGRLSHERGDHEFFLGRLQGVYSPARASASLPNDHSAW